MEAILAEREERLERLTISSQRGAEAASLLSNPLFQDIIDEQTEAVTQALLALPVGANEDRLALCTVLNVLRRFKSNLEGIKATGSFDARQLVDLVKDRPDA